MTGTRTEKYREYRQSIARSSESIPVLKTPVFDENTASAAGFYKKIVLKRRIENALILLSIVIIITLLVVFGIIVF